MRFWAVYERHTAKEGWSRLNTKRYESVIRCQTVLHERVRFPKSRTAVLDRVQVGKGLNCTTVYMHLNKQRKTPPQKNNKKNITYELE